VDHAGRVGVIGQGSRPDAAADSKGFSASPSDTGIVGAVSPINSVAIMADELRRICPDQRIEHPGSLVSLRGLMRRCQSNGPDGNAAQKAT